MAVENSLTVLEALYRQDFISQKQIVDGSDLKPSTVSNIIRELKASGLIREGGVLEGGGVGAKQMSLQIDPAFAWVASWQIDLKGNQLCLLDAAGHTMAVEKYPPDLGWKAVLDNIHERIAALAAQKRLSMKRFVGLGICVQGIVDHHRGEVICSQPHGMTSVPLGQMVSEKLGGIIHVERNIPCGAYLEQHVAPAHRKESFLYYLLRRHDNFFEHGTGIVLAGKVFHGSHSAAGELHEFLFPRPPLSTLKTESDWDGLYRKFGQSVGMLADFLDVDGIVVSSDDPGLTIKRFEMFEHEIQSHLRPIQNRNIRVARSQVGPEGMVAGVGLIVLHRYFHEFAAMLPNRSTSGRAKMEKG